MEMQENVVYEEDVSKIMKETVRIMRGLGRYIYPTTKTTLHSVALYSPKYGKLWYGDTDSKEWENIFYPNLMNLDDTAGWQLVGE